MQIYKLKGFKFFQNFLPRSIEKFGIICYILTDDAFFFASACLFVLWHCCSFALPHTQSPATPLKHHPHPWEKTNIVAFLQQLPLLFRFVNLY